MGAITGGLTIFECSRRMGPARPRPAQHAECRLRLTPALAGSLSRKHLLRLGLHQWRRDPPSPDLTSAEYLSAIPPWILPSSKSFGERFSASVNALNVGNSHLLIDDSLTFGGFHYNDPREVYGELRYRFHY